MDPFVLVVLVALAMLGIVDGALSARRRRIVTRATKPVPRRDAAPAHPKLRR